MQSWSDERWRRIAWSAWITLAVAASVKTIIEPELHTVYTAFSHCCRDWWAGHSLYQDRAFYYSPTFAVLMTPFAIWPDWFGGVLWNLASVGLLVAALQTFFREVLSQSPWRPARRDSFNCSCCSAPCAACGRGRATRCCWRWCCSRRRPRSAAVGSARRGCSRRRRTSKFGPPSPGLCSPPNIRNASPRVGLLAIAALGFLPLLTKAPATVIGAYADWYYCLAQRQASDFRFPGYRDAWTIWEQLGSPVDKHAYLILQAAGGLAVLAWLLWQRRRWPSGFGMHPQMAIYTVAAWSAWQLLLGPGTERLTYNIIAPALAWAVLSAYRDGAAIWSTLTYATTFVLGIGGMERLLSPRRPRRWRSSRSA